MSAPKQPSKANDYAVARELNDRVSRLLALLTRDWSGEFFDSYYNQDKDVAMAINRIYVLTVHELEKIYSQNKKLHALNKQLETCTTWTHFNVLESKEADIWLYVTEHKGEEDMKHIAQVNRLAILAGKEKPFFTPQQQRIIKEADRVNKELLKALNEREPSNPRKRGLYFIMNYKLSYADNGTIIVNDVLNLKKTQNGSAPRKLMEQALKHPYELFKPELGQLNRSISSVLSDMGITGILKELFFPIAKTDGVKFRPVVNCTTAEQEHIQTHELDRQLIKLGAEKSHILDNIVSEEPLSEEEKALYEQFEKERKNS